MLVLKHDVYTENETRKNLFLLYQKQICIILVHLIYRQSIGIISKIP